METKKLSVLFILFFVVVSCLYHTKINAQSCSGSWINNNPFLLQCIDGQVIGTLMPGGDPPGCPTNPTYPGTQTNTYNFDNPVNDFYIDLVGFTSTPGCARMRIRINGVFYPLSLSNLTELPPGTFCNGSLSYLTITTDGFLTTSSLAAPNSNGQARLIFSGVNASSITVSTNDAGGGCVVSNPCMVPLPLQILSFMGFLSTDCFVTLNFESGIESNVRNIEVQQSFDAISYSKVIELLPKGNDSRYTVSFRSTGSEFYRLKINDIDGTFSYSKIVRINSNCASLPIRISPNPAHNKIFIENVKPFDRLMIFDMLGRSIFQVRPLNHSAEINVNHLPSGTYFVKVLRNNVQIAVSKFLKN